MVFIINITMTTAGFHTEFFTVEILHVDPPRKFFASGPPKCWKLATNKLLSINFENSGGGSQP